MEIHEIITKAFRVSAALSMFSIVLFLYLARYYGYISPAGLMMYVCPMLAWIWVSLSTVNRIKELNEKK